MVPGNFMGTVLLTLRIPITEIIVYVRMIETLEERFCTLVASDLTDGALEYYAEFERVVAGVPSATVRSVQEGTESLLEFEQAFVHRSMFGVFMRIIADLLLGN